MKASRSTVNWYQTMYRGAVFSFSENQIGRTIMKKIRALLLVLLAAMLCALLAGCGEKDMSVSVTLVNRSGRDISSISITPSTSSDWDTEFVDGMFHDGESIESGLGTYKESEVPDTYNILVYNDENTILYDTSVDELDFAIQDGDYIVFLPPEGEVPIEITHDYDPSAYELDYEPTGYTEEELSGGDLSGYTGCWKLENEPFYFVINEEFEWIAINLYGEQVGPGYVVNEGECITLYMEDDSALVSLWQTAYGDLSDANGNTLTPMDYIMLLPTPEDELNQTASFPGGFTNVTINYPIQMAAHEHPNVSNALSFNAVMEDGTDDYYSNIMIAFQPIEGFDPYMEKGAAAAKTYMMKMLEDFMKSMYGSYLIKSWTETSSPTAPLSPCAAAWRSGITGRRGMPLSQRPSRSKAASATTLISATICSRRCPTLPAGAPPPRPGPPIPVTPATTARRITGTTRTEISGTGTAMRTSSSATAATATSTRIPANTWSRTTRAGTMTTNITTIMIHGPIPATAGATTRTTKTAGAITSKPHPEKGGLCVCAQIWR